MISETTETFAEIGTPANPFPGLRPFEFDESHLFFGRDGQSEQLISKLGRTRFLAVVGTSGSGKSSLVRAGLLPTLLGGFMTSAGSDWRIAIMRPGSDPIGNLAEALNSGDVFGSEIEENAAIQTAIAEATLRRGNLGLVDAVRQAGMPENENLLVLVDQFEEIFRFARVSEGESYHNDAAAFVKLILEASRQREVPIYVVLTMRSDYLGDCSQFWDLPEAINESQYLIPRLTRDQLREAIIGPAAVGLGQIAPRLVNRLLNDVGDDQDQLPILQHALMRSWDEWKVKGHDHQAQSKDDALDLCCYQFIGGMAEALSRHADEAFNELPDDRIRDVAGGLFKCLTEKGSDNREIRRPTTLGEMCAVVDATEAEAVTVIETFRQPGRSFLMPPSRVKLDSRSLIDISHESLIRCWVRLKTWVDEEARSARSYRRLAETASLYLKGEEGLLQGPGFLAALEWRENNKPNQGWARRYHPGFDEAISFLEESRRARDAKRKRSRVAIASVIGFLVVIIAVILILLSSAVNERKRSTSRELAASAMSQLQVDPELSLLLAIEGMRLAPTEKAEEALRQALAESHLQSCKKVDVGAINTTYFIPDQPLLLTTDDKGTANIWDVNTGERVSELNDGKPIHIEAFSRNGTVAAVIGEDGAALILDANSRTQLAELRAASRVTRAAFSRDGNLLVTTGNGVAQIWDWKNTTSSIATLKAAGDLAVSETAFSPDGTKVIIIDNSFASTARVWNWKLKSDDHQIVLKGHVDPIKTAEFSPDGKSIVTASDDATARIWEAATGDTKTDLLGHQGPVKGAQFSDDSKWVLTRSSDGTARVWDVATGRVLAEFRGHTGPVKSAIFLADKRTVMTAGEDHTIRVWRVSTEPEATAPLTHSDKLLGALFSPDGKLAVTSSEDNSARIWNASTGLAVVEPLQRNSWVNDAEFSPDGKLILTASFDRSAQVWDAGTGKPVVGPMMYEGPVISAVFSPDGRLILTAGVNGGVAQLWDARLWDAGTGESVAVPMRHDGRITSARFSPDGKLAVTASVDGTACVWEVSTGNRVSEMKHDGPVASAMFSPDGKFVVTASEDHTARIWDASTGAEVVRFVGHADALDYAEFSPDGKLVVTASRDRTARLWEARTGELRAELRGHQDWVLTATFSGDGKFVVTASGDRTAQVWHTESGICVARLLGHTMAVRSAAFDVTGKLIITASADNTARIFRCEVCDSSEEVLGLALKRVTRTLTPQERQRYLHESQKQ